MTTALASSTTALASLFRFKAWSNQELFGSLQKAESTLTAETLQKAIRTLNHIYVVDGIFRGHLENRPHGYKTTNTDPLPSLDELQLNVADLDTWYVNYSQSVSAQASTQALSDSIQFQFTDGDQGRMSREEILLHVITHGANHRGQVGQMIKDANLTPPRDLYTRFLHSTEPARRSVQCGQRDLR